MKRITAILAALLVLAMCVSVFAGCGSDNGSADTTTAQTTTSATTTTTTLPEKPDDPNTDNGDDDDGKITEPTVDVPADGRITTAEQLHAVLVNGESDKDYTVEAEVLDMGAYKWDGLWKYSGTFDFGGVTLKNCSYSLFNSVYGGTVKNLTISDSSYEYAYFNADEDFSALDGETPGNKLFSPVIRYATDVAVSNITVAESVTVMTDIYKEDSHIGGIIGETMGSAVVVEDCSFYGTITADCLLVNFGGIIGKMFSQDPQVINVEEPEKSAIRVVNCHNFGKIENLGTGHDSKVGGIVGYAENVAIVGCANYADVSSADNGQTAGVVGYVTGTVAVLNCLNSGDISGQQNVGGICGYSNGETRYFTNCVNLGKVTGEISGGFIGMMKNKESVTNCFNLSSATSAFSTNVNGETVDPDNSATHLDLRLTNCSNADSVETLFAFIVASAPDIFVMQGDTIVIA